MAEGPFRIDPTLIKYIAGLSNDLSAYGANTEKGFQPTGINKVTNDSITSQGFIKLLKQAMGPDSSSMKIDGKGIGITAPNDSNLTKMILGENYSDLVPANAAPASTSNSSSTEQSQAQPQPQPTSASSTPNPFAPSPLNLNIRPTDLAGLSPEHIMAVIGAKQQQDKIRAESYKDLVDSIYKGSQMRNAAEATSAESGYKKALTRQADANTLENTPSVDIKVGDSIMKVTPKDAIAWKKLEKETTPEQVKLYQYAKDHGFEGSIIDFRNSEVPEKVKLYDEAVKSGYPPNKFDQWYKEIIKLGVPTTGEAVGKQEALDLAKFRTSVQAPDLTQKIEKQLSANRMTWNDPSGVEALRKRHPEITREQAVKALQRQMVRKELDRMIQQAYPGAIWTNGKGWVTPKGEFIRGDY